MIMGFRWLGGAIGLFLLWSAIFLTESQERRVHSRLETLWIQVDDLKARAVPSHTALIAVAALWISPMLDRIFGRQLVTVKAISTSAMWSTATVFAIFAGLGQPLLFDLRANCPCGAFDIL
jgi:hypothetical protein